MSDREISYTIFMLLRTTPAWLRLSRPERNAIAEEAFGFALKDGTVDFSYHDAEAFSGRATDVAVFKTAVLFDYYKVVERLRDSKLFTEPYYEVVDIIPTIEEGFRHFEAEEVKA
ncbi:MAG: darcynin family protein [Parvibaculum sp.]|nr:darcynin family protein [Parvibaculum sp.]|tara:strand:- start:4457 stop:4801 length:345 start_codon:yes stop_codon:yes gene_type:complete